MFLASPLCPTLSLRHALFGFSSDKLLVVPKVFCYLLNVSKFYIWVARNDFRFQGKRPTAMDVMERVKSRVRFYLPLFFRSLRSSRRLTLLGACHSSQTQKTSYCRLFIISIFFFFFYMIK